LSIIEQGRTGGGYAIIQNIVLDGLLQYGGVDLAGFYLALKRFIDRRQDPGSKQTMDWSVRLFCIKFNMGQQRFYRLAEKLWQLGLLDVTKACTPEGWQNKYLVHDYAASQGPLVPIRDGTFKYRRAAEENPSTPEEQPEATGGHGELSLHEDDGGISKTDIPSECEDREGISISGIPEMDTLIKDKNKENNKIDEYIKNQSISQSIHLENLSVKERQADRLIDFSDQKQLVGYYAGKFGATERQVVMAMLSVQAQVDQGTVIIDYKAYLEKTLQQLVQDEQIRTHFVGPPKPKGYPSSSQGPAARSG